ncbi:MAG TPA: hypothetical protein VIA18_12680 [Polyangia bacterium]|jgi:hypothetical protein|nr:hypothetical protein [Polyangia bacterium]
MSVGQRLGRAIASALVLVGGLGAVAVADETPGAAERTAYLAAALAALRATPADALAQETNYAQVMSRSSCASDVERLKLECLMTASRQYCRKKGGETQRCAADLDVIVAKLLGDAQLIPTAKRYEIMTAHKDYRRALADESRRLAGALAVDFRLRMGPQANDADLARAIDRYCLATSDDNAMPWQACASSLVWFIATAADGSGP